MEAHARRAAQENGKARQEMAVAMTARLFPTRLLRALQSYAALATRAILEMMEAHARCVSQASTRSRLVMRTAAAAQQTRARLRRAQL